MVCDMETANAATYNGRSELVIELPELLVQLGDASICFYDIALSSAYISLKLLYRREDIYSVHDRHM